MKKIVLLFGIGLMTLALVGCDKIENSEDIWDKDGSEIEIGTSEENAEKIVKNWMKSVLNAFDYENQFDTSLYQENNAQKVKEMMKQELKWKVFYSNEEVILVYFRDVDNQSLGHMALVLKEGHWIATGNAKTTSFTQEQMCNICEGKGVIVIENKTKKCNSCSGEGIFTYVGDDVDLGIDSNGNNQLPTGITQDFADKVISDFVSDKLNTYNLDIGDTHKPTAALWAEAGGYVYSSDPNVITISSGGKVTAVGNGTAYVIISSKSLNMYEVYKYIVGDKTHQVDFDKLIEEYVPSVLDSIVLKVGEVHKPGAALWISDGSGTVYSSNESVVTISEYGKVTAVGKGTAHIVIVAKTGMTKVYLYTIE